MHRCVPPFILNMLAKEAVRNVVCGPSAEKDMTVEEIAAAASSSLGANASHYQAIGPNDLVYEVARQHTTGTIIYMKEHMQRFGQSIEEVFGNQHGISKDATLGKEQIDAIVSDAVASVQRLQKAHHNPEVDGATFFEQNIKYVAWEDADNNNQNANKNTICAAKERSFNTLAFYIKSTYPPADWYTRGATLALLFGLNRPNPHAKVVYPALKEKAAQQIAQLGVFESLIVHDDGVVPEGVRSNFILVTPEGKVLSSLDESILIGTTLLAVRNQCKALGIPMESKRILLEDVLRADAIAMLGTSVNVLPISRLVVAKEDQSRPVASPLMPLISTPYTVTEKSLPAADGAVCIVKDSGSNDILKRLNEAYTRNTFV